MLKKIKDKVIKEELDPKKERIKKEAVNRGIFNIQLFSKELGLVEPDVNQGLKELVEKGHIKGYFIFNDTEFVTFDYLKIPLNEKIEKTFKLDLNKQYEDLGVDLSTIIEVINELCRANIQHGFFDTTNNFVFYHLSEKEEEKMVSKLNNEKVHITEIADYINNIIESRELDVSSLISEVKREKDTQIDDLESLAKDAIDSNLGIKRARLWIKNLITWNRIKGTYIDNQEFFISDKIINKELTDIINKSGHVKLSDVQNKLNFSTLEYLKSKLKNLEKDGLIKGCFTSNENEYMTENKALEELITFINEKKGNPITFAEINGKMGFDKTYTNYFIKKLISDKRINGLLSEDFNKFFSIDMLNKTIKEYIEKNDRIKLADINGEFKLSQKDLIDQVEQIINKYNLRVLVTADKSEVIKEEKMLYILMNNLKKSPKSILSEVSKNLNLETEKIVNLIKYMLEFGLIKGDLTKKEFILK